MFNYYRVSSISFDVKLADIDANCDSILKIWKQKDREHSSLLVFPELSISGYSCEDLFFQEDFISQIYKGLLKLKEESKHLSSIAIVGSAILFNSKLYDCAVVIQGGKILGIVPKSYISNCYEAYERRWFAGSNYIVDEYVDILGNKVAFGTDLLFEKDRYFCFGVELAGDLRNIIPVSSYQALGGATILTNLTASSDMFAKRKGRSLLINSQAKRCNALYIYSSGGVGESGKDYYYLGDTCISDMGVEVARSNYADDISSFYRSSDYDCDCEKLYFSRLKESLHDDNAIPSFRKIPVEADVLDPKEVRVNISSTPFILKDEDEQFEECKTILSAALNQRLKASNSKKVIIGLSGGVDSAFAFLIAVETFKKYGRNLSDIIAVSIPGLATSDRTQNNSKKLAEALNTRFMEIDISESMKQYFKDIELTDTKNIAYENSQARKRSSILFDIANKENGINLGTGDLSESFLGWCTYAGDQMSSYNLNSSIPKTLIKHFIYMFAKKDYKDSTVSRILEDINATPISPELREDQNTEELLAPYVIVDLFIYFFIKYGFSIEKIVFLIDKILNKDKKTYDKEFIRTSCNMCYDRWIKNQFKRSACPDGVCVTGFSLSSRRGFSIPSDIVKNK